TTGIMAPFAMGANGGRGMSPADVQSVANYIKGVAAPAAAAPGPGAPANGANATATGAATPGGRGGAPGRAGAPGGAAAAGGAPARGGAAPNPAKPGYSTPPENSGGLYPVAGEPVWRDRCVTCHGTGQGGAPSYSDLEKRSPEAVYNALKTGKMAGQTQGLTDAQLYGVVRFITGKSPTPNTLAGVTDANTCATHPAIKAAPPAAQWNGWGNGLANTRYQPNPGFTAAQVPQLKVKWAFSYPGTKNSMPLVWNDRVFVASMAGHAYSLDAKSGCVHWRYDWPGGTRASMTIAPMATAQSKFALFIGDDRSWVRALDAGSGKELWKVQADTHKVGRITASPSVYNNVVYVTMSFSEESQGNVAAYECCTGIGTVIAIDARNGHILWRQSILGDVKPAPTRRNMAGTQMYGPAGGAIWSAPTIDPKRNQLYVTTGDSYTEINHPASDAVVAMDLKTGRIKWTKQVLAGDNFMSGTVNGPTGTRGPDFDFGSSAILTTIGGKDMLFAPNKSSSMYALDPDTGNYLWPESGMAKHGIGGASGGFLWGSATDGTRIYAPSNDAPGRGKPGLFALDVKDGHEVWRYDATPVASCSTWSGRCSQGMPGAATAMPGIVFATSADGHLRAFQTADGKLVWDYDTALHTDTVNGLKGQWG
ncbi:MAG: PQQ-binding-like beta-propeller repeat protein, partial [Alphaproteobacteria bacterium]